MRDVRVNQVNISISSEVNEVSQSPSPEERGERRLVKQAPSLQPAPGPNGERRTASVPRPPRERARSVKLSKPPPECLVGGEDRTSREVSEEVSAGQSGAVRRSSRLRSSTVTSLMEEDAQSDSENNKVPSDAAFGDPGEAIESILDHRTGKPGATGKSTKFWTVRDRGDPNVGVKTSEAEQQFLVKWSGRSHINNTWESQSSLAAMKELRSCRKLSNYQKKLSQLNSWRRTASPDEVEDQEVELQRDRQLRDSYTDIERIFAERRKEDGTRDFFVKWKILNYEDATWEEESMIKAHYGKALSEYNIRKESTNSNPRNFQESLTNVSTVFRPLRAQPSFLGSCRQRLRDYQLAGCVSDQSGAGLVRGAARVRHKYFSHQIFFSSIIFLHVYKSATKAKMEDGRG
jgi:chromodomain-helicase-DNA-binding protein 1